MGKLGDRTIVSVLAEGGRLTLSYFPIFWVMTFISCGHYHLGIRKEGMEGGREGGKKKDRKKEKGEIREKEGGKEEGRKREGVRKEESVP